MRLHAALVAGFMCLTMLMGGAIGIWAAMSAYDDSNRWFSQAVYLSECTAGKPDAGSAGCAKLRGEFPDSPFGVELTDPTLASTLASTTHNTAGATITLTALAITIASFFLTLTLFLLTSHRAHRDRVRHGVLGS